MPESAWFLTRGASQAAAARVVCFAHAGGNPRAFLDWQDAVGGGAEVVAVCMPGRGPRADEARPRSVADLADGAAAAIGALADRPIVLFGHSLGALLAFEVARRLRGLGALGHLVASGCAAPSLLPSARVRRAAALEGRAFAEAVEFFGGLPPNVLADDELCQLLLPGVQADLRLVAGYRYEADAPLDVRLSLVNGRDDPHVTAATLQPWETESRHAPVRHWIDGGHFYFERRPDAVAELLAAIAAESSGRAASEHVEVI